MRSPEQIADWLVDSITHVLRAARHVRDLAKRAERRLAVLHAAWAFVVDREAELRQAEAADNRLTHPEYAAQRPAGYFDKVNDNSDFQPVLEHWREVGRRVGIRLPNG